MGPRIALTAQSCRLYFRPMRRRLFVPGPVQICRELYAAMSAPMTSHRSEEYQALHRRILERLRMVLRLRSGHLFLVTSSSTGVMEATIRNLVRRRVLFGTNGFFSERWRKTAEENGKEAAAISVEWGKAIHGDALAAALRKSRYEAFAVAHCETSTGVLNNLEEISEALRRSPNTLFLVDAVSTWGALKLDVERLGIDAIFAGIQKGFACPPGLTIVWLSDRAFERAKRNVGKGIYFDLTLYEEYQRKWQTPFTPALTLLRALDWRLERMIGESAERRDERFRSLARRCREWFASRGFQIFPEPGYESPTVTAVLARKGDHLADLRRALLRRGFELAESYGPIADSVLRIGHLGDVTEDDLDALLRAMEKLLRPFGRPRSLPRIASASPV